MPEIAEIASEINKMSNSGREKEFEELKNKLYEKINNLYQDINNLCYEKEKLENEKEELNKVLIGFQYEFNELKTEKDRINGVLIGFQLDSNKVLLENETLKTQLEELRREKTLFFGGKSEEDLKQTLKGYKASYTRAVNEGREDTAKELDAKIVQLTKIIERYNEAN